LATGNIKKNEIIKQTDISELKQAIIDIYKNRNFLSDAGLTKITADSAGFGNTSIEIGNYIN